jgi:hypothetical protein
MEEGENRLGQAELASFRSSALSHTSISPESLFKVGKVKTRYSAVVDATASVSVEICKAPGGKRLS